MPDKMVVEQLTKIFGSHPKSIIPLVEKGMTKAEVLKKTGHTIGINKVSFSVKEGEMFVIMGLSGSGKSTLIRCLNMLNKPTSGQIKVDGEDIVKYNHNQLKMFRQKKIAMVFQHFGLFDHRTVQQNVEYGLEIRGIEKSEREEIARENLKKVGLEGWEDKNPSELSGGMQQRVGLARALANNPDILLMDEPFSALDPLIRRDMQLELLDIQSDLKKTVIFITHDVNEAFKIGDRVAVMKDGQIEQIGTPEEILANPSSDYIEQFVKDTDRSKVLQAQNVMSTPSALVILKDGLNVAIKEMKDNKISSVFVVDQHRKLKGIVTIDDALQAKKEDKKLVDILRTDINTAGLEDYISDLIPYAVETKYPIAIVDETNKFRGIVARVDVLSGLV